MPASSRSPSWAALADAIGHCMLIFAFVPTLVALPRWLAFEATNSLNLEDPLVLVFLPVRGIVLLLNEFREGVVPGVLAGVLDGVVLCAWMAWHGGDVPLPRKLAVGAVSGLVAAGLMVVGALLVAGGAQPIPVVAVSFELASGVVCGMIAAPIAIRLLTGAAMAPANPRPNNSGYPRSSRGDTSRPA